MSRIAELDVKLKHSNHLNDQRKLELKVGVQCTTFGPKRCLFLYGYLHVHVHRLVYFFPDDIGTHSTHTLNNVKILDLLQSGRYIIWIRIYHYEHINAYQSHKVQKDRG